MVHNPLQKDFLIEFYLNKTIVSQFNILSGTHISANIDDLLIVDVSYQMSFTYNEYDHESLQVNRHIETIYIKTRRIQLFEQFESDPYYKTCYIYY